MDMLSSAVEALLDDADSSWGAPNLPPVRDPVNLGICTWRTPSAQELLEKFTNFEKSLKIPKKFIHNFEEDLRRSRRFSIRQELRWRTRLWKALRRARRLRRQ